MNTKIDKIHYPKEFNPPTGGQYTKYPYIILPYLPDCECFFDAWHGVVGYDILPFAITTRIASDDLKYLKEYVE